MSTTPLFSPAAATTLRRDLETEKIPILLESKNLLENISREMAVLAQYFSQLDESRNFGPTIERLQAIQGRIEQLSREMDELIDICWSVLGTFQTPGSISATRWPELQLLYDTLSVRTESVRNRNDNLNAEILNLLPALRLRQ